MKELISEQQAERIVAVLCLATLLIGPWASWVMTRSVRHSIFFASLGPVLYALWRVYNAIENYYGLDSVKALEINAAIFFGVAAVLAVLYVLIIDRTSAPRAKTSRRRAV